MAEQIIIEFLPDTSKLAPVIDQLEALGQIDKQAAAQFRQTNAALTDREAIIAANRKGIDDLSKSVKNMPDDVGKEFLAGMLDELKKAGVSWTEFLEALKKGAPAALPKVQSIKNELKDLREQMARATLAGKDFGDEFEAMRQKAGELDDALGDVNKTIKKTGSDTRTIEGITQAIGTMAAGFSVAQGAAALFGDESKQLQETLLKVNSAMAIANGIQQISVALQKDSALSLLLLNTQKKIEVVQTNLATAAESENIVVKYAAIAAQKIFNAVLSANPIGIVITAIAALASILVIYAGNARKAAEDQASLNAAMQSGGDELDAFIDANNRANEKLVSDLKARGVKQSEILKTQNRNDLASADAIATERIRLNQVLNDTMNSTDKDTQKQREAAQKQLTSLETKEANLRKDIYIRNNDIIIAKEDERKKAIEDRQKAQEKADKATKDELDSILGTLQLQTDTVGNSTIAWLEMQKQVVNAKAAVDAFGKTKGEKLAIMQAASDQIDELQAKIDFLNLQIKAMQISAAQAAAHPPVITPEIAVPPESMDAAVAAVVDPMEAAGNLIIKHTIKNLHDANQEILKGHIEAGLQAAQQFASLASDVFKQVAEQQQLVIDHQRAGVQELLDAGAISEKEATKRLQHLDNEEKKIKRQSAIRDKEIAVFNAAINTAEAITKASPDPFLIGLAIALGAAQMGVILSRPIPKFGRGKKDSWRGVGLVGEAGAELVEDDGKMFLVTSPTKVFLKSSSKVYTPKETQSMLMNTKIGSQVPRGTPSPGIDYDKLGKTIGENLPKVGFSFDENGFTAFMNQKLSFTKYLGLRRGNL